MGELRGRMGEASPTEEAEPHGGKPPSAGAPPPPLPLFQLRNVSAQRAARSALTAGQLSRSGGLLSLITRPFPLPDLVAFHSDLDVAPSPSSAPPRRPRLGAERRASGATHAQGHPRHPMSLLPKELRRPPCGSGGGQPYLLESKSGGQRSFSSLSSPSHVSHPWDSEDASSVLCNFVRSTDN